MAQVRITNENIWTTDFAEADRKKCLRSLNRKVSSIPSCQFQSLRSVSAWMTDVSATDRRSVKAQLAGCGDCRSLWWQTYSRLLQILTPCATLEERMFRFHSFHHQLTFFRLQTIEDFYEIFTAIKRQGLWAGILCAIAQRKRSEQGQP